MAIYSLADKDVNLAGIPLTIADSYSIPISDVSIQYSNPDRTIFSNPYKLAEPQILDRGFPFLTGNITFGHTSEEQEEELLAFLSAVSVPGNTFIFPHGYSTFTSKDDVGLGIRKDNSQFYSAITGGNADPISNGDFVVGPYSIYDQTPNASVGTRVFTIREVNPMQSQIKLFPDNYTTGTIYPTPIIHASLIRETEGFYILTKDAKRLSTLPTSINFREVPIK